MPDLNPPRNRLLASLPPDSLGPIVSRLAPVPLAMRQVIYQSDAAIEAVYFIEAGMISIVANLDDGMQAEVGIIGPEGVAGVSLVSGNDVSFNEYMVQMPGEALRMAAGDFRRELDGNAPFRALMLRYNEALGIQITQTAACNGRHGLEQRLARWLLMAHDRANGGELPLTQDFIGMMLGVHRPSITVTAGILQRAGLIRYANGRVTVLDRASLEAASCECYGTVRSRQARLLGPPPAVPE